MYKRTAGPEWSSRGGSIPGWCIPDWCVSGWRGLASAAGARGLRGARLGLFGTLALGQGGALGGLSYMGGCIMSVQPHTQTHTQAHSQT